MLYDSGSSIAHQKESDIEVHLTNSTSVKVSYNIPDDLIWSCKVCVKYTEDQSPYSRHQVREMN